MNRLKCFLLIIILVSCNTAYQENFDINGNLESRLPVSRKGIYEGVGYYYYPDGQIEKKVTYEENQLVYCRTFYENGMLYWQTGVKSGKKDGKYFEFDTIGNLRRVIEYVEGVRYVSKEYDSTGAQTFEFRLLCKDSIPDFRDEFIFIENNTMLLDSFKTIIISIPSIPNSQIVPILSGGIAKPIDSFQGKWLAKVNRYRDTVLIGLRIELGNSDSKFIGYKKVLMER